MDGYIKSKKKDIRSVRENIFLKCVLTFPLILFALIWVLGIYVLGTPDDWKDTEVVFSHISYESVGLQRWRSYVLNGEDGGKYVIQTNLLSAEELKEKLIYGERYSLVYQDKNAGGRHIAALYNEHNTFLDLSLSVAAWEKERQECFLGLYVSIGLELLALILIDRLWCREEHARIRKYRQDIENRKARFANKGKT